MCLVTIIEKRDYDFEGEWKRGGHGKVCSEEREERNVVIQLYSQKNWKKKGVLNPKVLVSIVCVVGCRGIL